MPYQTDRRSSQRFPIVREIRYQLLGKRARQATGRGETLNISSSGVLFTCESLIRTWQRVELCISWPARLDGKLELMLVVRGRVVRSEPGQVALRIEHYEFRTRPQVFRTALSSWSRASV
jgi:hypothetical protein